MDTPIVGIFGMLVTVVAVFLGTVGVIHALLKQKRDLLRAILIGAAIWLAAYLLVLISVSVVSRAQVLGPGAEKRFCGFYLDCHLAASIGRVDTADVIGGGNGEPSPLRADGTWWIVTVRVSSNARRARLALLQPRLTVVDDIGTEYPRVPAAERALGDTTSLERRLGPRESLVRRVVFDLPRGVRRPRLQFTEGYWIDRLIELLLIGDEDSLMHGKTTFRLQASG
jgi:hypothetical protein